MHIGKMILAAAVLMFSVSTSVIASDTLPHGINVKKTEKGDVLADSNDMTLYTFDKDTAGQSACVEQCAIYWPAVKAADNFKAHGNWASVKRTDGVAQLSYKTMPLYTFVQDKTAADILGDGKANGAWHIATP